MADSRFDSVKRVLSEHTFEPEGGSNINNLLCAICQKLMQDPCQTSCGCHYCFGCIKSFISNGNTYCPGGRTECKEECINLERDVFRNVRLATRISKIIVKCPNESCFATMELRHVEEHLHGCGKQLSQCPYATFGCDDQYSPKDQILAHLNGEIFSHTELVALFMNNVRNDFDGLKEMFELMKSEIGCLREELSNREVHSLPANIQTELNKESMIAVLKEEVKGVREELETLVQTMKIELERREAELDEQRREIEERDNIQLQINELKTEMYELRMEVDKSNEDKERKMNNLIRLNKLRPNVDMDFVWRVEDYSKKRRTVTDVYSEPFHSHHYKLCLNLYIYGDNVGVWCVIMKGEKDDYLEWPMKRTVTLSILDQDTMSAYKSVTFQYDTYQRNKRAFDRPKNERNDFCVGTDSLIRYSQIKDCASVHANDCLVVSCAIR